MKAQVATDNRNRSPGTLNLVELEMPESKPGGDYGMGSDSL
jgi:hypothetical protein